LKRSELELLVNNQEEEAGGDEKMKSPNDLLSPVGKKGRRLDETELQSPDEPLIIPQAEVIRRLRDRGEPIRLFGESDADVCHRLRHIEIQAPEVVKGLRNDLKDALDKIDQQYLDELIQSQGSDKTKLEAEVQITEDDTTMDDLVEMAKKMGKGDPAIDQEVVLKFLKLLLTLWGRELNNRPQAEKRSMQGKLASATHNQTVSYLKPLLQKLKKKAAPPDIRVALTEIVSFMIDRDYIQAHEAYLRMAIGNAPWPLGVTMVGIHARTGREKIFAQNVAHVMNDEVQRKYIQGLKRLMTVCQRHFPTDLTKCVDFNV
jgi:pre-mRNA-splicing factor 18